MRWSCAALALSLEARRGLRVSAEAVRRWWHALDWRWKRAQLSAKDNDPDRAGKLARIRFAAETLRPRATLLFADELDIHLLPKTGYQWMPKGTQVEVLTPGKNEKHYGAGAWDFRTGTVHYCNGPRKTNQLFRDLLDSLELRYPTRRYDRIFVVVDNYKIHKAQAVERWLAAHSRFELLWLPTYCPRANPIERVFGDTHDKGDAESQTKTPARLGGRCEPTLGTQRSLVLPTLDDLSRTGHYSSPPETQAGETRCLNVRPTMWNDLVAIAGSVWEIDHENFVVTENGILVRVYSNYCN